MSAADAPAPAADKTRNLDRHAPIHDDAKGQAQAAVDGVEGRGLVDSLESPKIDEVECSNIMVMAYGKLTSLMMSRTCCSGFPFCLPLPNTILGKAKKQTKEEILAIIKGKCPKDYLTAKESSLDKEADMRCCCPRKPVGAPLSRQPAGGAPPSADNV